MFEQEAEEEKAAPQPGVSVEEEDQKTPDGGGPAGPPPELANVERSAQDVGNVTAQAQCYFEYGINREVLPKFGKLEKFPFQVQIHYTKLDGSRMIRIITQEQNVTEDRQKVEENVNIELMGGHFAQKSAAFAQQGNYEVSRALNYSSAAYMDRVAHRPEQQRQWGRYMQNAQAWDGALQDEERTEAAQGMRFGSAQAQSRSRRVRRSGKDAMSSRMYKMKKGKY